MADKKIQQLAEQFDGLTIKTQMKILALKSSNSKLYYKEILSEFEKTLLQAMLEKYDYNLCRMSLDIRLHRNTIAAKLKKYNIKEKKRSGK